MLARHIVFVPGKNPKPPPALHRELLWRTLCEGVRRADPALLSELASQPAAFELVAWNSLYYGDTKDPSRDLPWIDALINTHAPSEADVREAQSWHRHVDRALYTLIDAVPALMRFLPEPMRRAAEELARYFENRDGIAHRVRELLKQVLRPLLTDRDRVLIVGHSMGSVIAYDALWELAHVERVPGRIDLFLSLGSPLGMSYVQHRLQGADREGAERYPTNLRRWVNIAAVGDLTALDRDFRDDFRAMLQLGLIEGIEDHTEGIYNFFRNEDGLDVHRSYGYLVNPVVGKVIADWWREGAAD